jgi:hypothetical protein
VVDAAGASLSNLRIESFEDALRQFASLGKAWGPVGRLFGLPTLRFLVKSLGALAVLLVGRGERAAVDVATGIDSDHAVHALEDGSIVLVWFGPELGSHDDLLCMDYA